MDTFLLLVSYSVPQIGAHWPQEQVLLGRTRGLIVFMSGFRHTKHNNQQYIQYKEDKKPIDSIELHRNGILPFLASTLNIVPSNP